MKKVVVIGYCLLLVVIAGLDSPAKAEENPQLSAKLAEIIEADGIDRAMEFARTDYYSGRRAYAVNLEELVGLGMKLFQADRRLEALRLGEFLVEINPDNAMIRSVLAQVNLHSNNIGRARQELKRALELEPQRIGDIVLLKSLTFVPDDFIVPTLLQTESFRIRPLRASDAELDYRAVMNSLDHLQGVFGQGEWPQKTLTLEEDRQALKGHEIDFPSRRSFTFTIMNPAETECLGCIYIYPARLDDFDAEVVMWVSLSAFEAGLDERVFETLRNWLAKDWPFERVAFPGREISFAEYIGRLEDQDSRLAKQAVN